MFDFNVCFPGKAAGLFGFGWPLLPGIVAELAQQDHSQPLLLRDVLEGRQAQMFTGCGTGRLHLFPAQELYSREELHDLREDVGPWGHPPAAARLRAAGFWPLGVGRGRRKEIYYVISSEINLSPPMFSYFLLESILSTLAVLGY